MDINSLKINLGLLEDSTERARTHKTIYRGSVAHVLSTAEEQREELVAFLADVDRVIAEAREVCRV